MANDDEQEEDEQEGDEQEEEEFIQRIELPTRVPRAENFLMYKPRTSVEKACAGGTNAVSYHRHSSSTCGTPSRRRKWKKKEEEE